MSEMQELLTESNKLKFKLKMVFNILKERYPHLNMYMLYCNGEDPSNVSIRQTANEVLYNLRVPDFTALQVYMLYPSLINRTQHLVDSDGYFMFEDMVGTNGLKNNKNRKCGNLDMFDHIIKCLSDGKTALFTCKQRLKNMVDESWEESYFEIYTDILKLEEFLDLFGYPRLTKTNNISYKIKPAVTLIPKRARPAKYKTYTTYYKPALPIIHEE